LITIITSPIPQPIVQNTANDEVFEWKVNPVGGALLGKYRIQIVDSTNATISDSSDAPFSIVAAGTTSQLDNVSQMANTLESARIILNQMLESLKNQ